MGDRSMTTCIGEMIQILRDAFPGESLQIWYDDGFSFEELSWDSITAQEAFAHAWGYLQGVADAADVTVLEMLGSFGYTLDVDLETFYRCNKAGCRWVGQDPDERRVKGQCKRSCPACWKHDHRRVTVEAFQYIPNPLVIPGTT